MKAITHRARVLAAVEHRQPDRVPIDIGGSSTTTIIGSAYERLKQRLGVTEETRYMKRKSRSAILADAIAERLGADTRPLIIGGPDGWQDIYFPDGSFRDEWGVVWVKPEGGHYNPLGNPLKDATLTDLEQFSFPDPRNPGRTRGLREQARRLHEETDYAVILNLPVGFVHQTQYLRGYENFLVDLLTNREFIDTLMDRTLDWWLKLAEAVLAQVGDYVDVVQFGDDVAFQERPMVNMKMYREIFRPRHQQMIETIKRHSRAKVMYHCCGSVRPLIQDFIEMGVDALNPVQVSSVGMDTAELKAQFGDRICFWGGIDTSHILPRGTQEQVRAEVQKRIHDLSANGGFVLASVHNIQEDVPPENILAMADAAMEFGRGGV